ncbi:putative nuclease HARBI1 [Osmia bicornis bicornis]|uniref:putative nuclease HARBI1 n=1 Tax=Osmia bicornis bicornis TaxID=1437191 RepID=UPI001EAE91C7|nr:putative nuclease HARBI1 [Osmia bicornis bicornis]
MDFEDIDDIEDIEDIQNEHSEISRRYIRDGSDPFDCFDEDEFRRRYRFTKDSVLNEILPKIEAGLQKSNNRGLPIPPAMQLLICLRYYATASFQLILGDTMNVSQPTVSRIVFRVRSLIGSLITEYIKFPRDPDNSTQNRRLFNNLGHGDGTIGLPGVDGAIDCTHIRLTASRFNNMEELYRNRKGYFSLNVQVLLGPCMEFLDIVPEWPGSAHDSRIFRTSRLHMRYATGELDGILVGDGGYPCLPFTTTS